MKHKHLRRSAAGIMTGLMCMMSAPALTTAVFNTATAYAASAGQTFSVGNGQTQHKGDNVDGYSYEIWLDRTGGSGSMTLGSGGSFNTQWSAQVSSGNFLARRGRNYDASKKATQYGTIVMDYAADYSASSQGNSRLCVYGWMKDPLVEYYIIEDWVNWRPSGQSQTVTIDGAEYEIFQLDNTGPTILGDTRTFKQYFSVRKQKRTSGTITVSDHFKAWEKAGWNIGNLTEVALNVEGWESSGKANVSKLTISAGGGGQQQTAPVTTQPQQQNNWNNNNNQWNPQQNDWNNNWNNNNWNNNNWNNNQNNPPQQNNNAQTSASSSSFKGAFAPWFKIGTSVSPHELGSGASFLKENYSSITPENELKPDSILDQQACQQRGNNVNTQINLSRAAQTLKFCEENGISLRGHTFVWYSQTPDWFFRENFSQNGAYVSKDIMDKRLESMIKNTFEALKTQYPKLDVYSYDVCNELFLNDGGGMRPANNSNWVRVYGDDSFVINAFKYARQYAPAGCKLYLNDYNEYIPAKTNDIYNMAMKLKQLGYIDGIGMQSHLDTSYPDAKTYETALKKFLSTGLEVQITELDITANNDNAQADLYESIFKLAMEHADQIPAVTVWGTTDNVSWRAQQNPLLFKAGYQPKLAYNRIIALTANGQKPVTTQAPVTQQVVTTTTVAQPQNNWNNDWNNNNWNNDWNNNNNNQWNPQQNNNAGTPANGQKYSVGNGMNQHKGDNVDGYSYEIWLDQTGGSGSMTLGSGGAFDTEWSAQVNAGNFLARRGRNYDASKKATQYGTIVMDYAADYSASAQGNSRLCVYGWMKDPLVEYYIIEDWVNWRPSGQSQTVTIDGAEYEIFQLNHTGPTILGDTRTFKQYFSVRKQKRTSGTITVSDHFKAWEKAGWNIGNLTEVALNVEGWESSGKANVSKLTISEGTGNNNNQPQQMNNQQPQQQNNDWNWGWNNNDWNTQQPANTDVQVSGVQDLTGKKLVAISFDDGASATSRQDPAYRIMDALIKNNFHATFFYVGDWIKTNEQVQFAYQNGMEVANHTKSHPSLGSLDAGTIRSEWEQCNSKLKSIIGAEPSHIMRLPYLDGGGQVKSALYDVPLISCGVDTKDWDGASADQIVNTIKSAAQNGTLQNQIVLCHENYASTALAMETVLPWLKENGWEVVTVSDMFAANGKQLQGGQIYTRS